MKATAGEVYTVYNQYLKRYTACQVAYIAPPDSVSKQPWAVVLSLDWVGDAPLTAEELPQLRPLYKDFMYWSRDLHLLRVPVEVPPQYTLVGTLPPFTDQPCCPYQIVVFRYHFGVSSPVLPGVVPPLNLTAAYRSLWYARFGQGSSISLPKVMALHRRGSISHTGWSFDWNNPSMNYLYHRTFLCPVPYVHKVGIRGKNQKFPRLRKV